MNRKEISIAAGLTLVGGLIGYKLHWYKWKEEADEVLNNMRTTIQLYHETIGYLGDNIENLDDDEIRDTLVKKIEFAEIATSEMFSD